MPDAAHFSLFLMTAAILLIIPGPAVLYIVARSLEQGKWAGIVSVLGISAATLVHTLAASLGLSALLASSATAFTLVKYLGAAYLIYLGVRTLISPQKLQPTQTLKKRKLARLFIEGFIVNLLNPKTALFFFAFLPQFINLNQGPVSHQIFILGVTMTLLGTFSDGLWAIFAGSISSYLQRSPGAMKIQAYLSGSTLLGLGVTTAMVKLSRN